MDDFIYKYYIKPILYYEGYNPVNTITYALLAIFSAVLIFLFLRKKKIINNPSFILGLFSFILLGSSMRVVTDAVDGGAIKPITPLHSFILESHLYDYGFFTVSPFIYVKTAFLFLISLFLLYKIDRLRYLPYIGFLGFLFHFFILLPFFRFWFVLFPILVLVLLPSYFAYKRYGLNALPVFAHSLDGGATFFAIDFFGKISGISYGEQHVVSRFLGELFNTYFTFYLVKVLISYIIVRELVREKIDDEIKTYILILVATVGFAPGIRNLLRMMVGA